MAMQLAGLIIPFCHPEPVEGSLIISALGAHSKRSSARK